MSKILQRRGHLRRRLAGLMPCLWLLPALANDPGGGTNGVGANITLTDNGTMPFIYGTGLHVSGTFVNRGLLDLLTGAQGLPANFINHGVVIDSNGALVQTLSVTDSNLTVSLRGFAGHTYPLQRTPSLKSPAWTNIGPPETGTGEAIQLLDASRPRQPVLLSHLDRSLNRRTRERPATTTAPHQRFGARPFNSRRAEQFS